MSRRALSWGALAAALLTPLVVVGLPVWLIQPFAPQTPVAVAWSWRLKQAAPWVSAAALLLTLACTVRLWRPPRTGTTRWRTMGRRVALVSMVGVAGGLAWFARQNHFEWMFRPFPDPRFVAAAEATDLPGDEPVIGIAQGTHALAFPITRIGYHHLVNAALGDEPIVATY